MVAEKILVDNNKSEPINNSTVSTKLSTDQLICKTPQNSTPSGSIKSLRHEIPLKDDRSKEETPVELHLGVLQIVFGLLMAVLGVMVLVNEASLSQIGGGLWGGCLATLTGVMGVLSAAKDCCPLKTNPQRMALTAFLALSLISLAMAHLVLVIAAIGLARDAAKTDEFADTDGQDKQEDLTLPSNYSAMLTGAGLLLVAGCECVAAAVGAYRAARALCPCFRGPHNTAGVHRDCAECGSALYAPISGKHLLVSRWLGKQQPPPHHPAMHQQPVYVVANNTRKGITPITVAPMFTLPSPPSSLMAPPVVGYPALIPAPLGTTPPPFLTHPVHHPRPVERQAHKKRRRYPSDRQLQRMAIPQPQEKSKKQKKSRARQKTITTEEVTKTYTGLDRVIAEEFIEICDSNKNTSTSGSSDSSACTNSDVASNEFARDKF